MHPWEAAYRAERLMGDGRLRADRFACEGASPMQLMFDGGELTAEVVNSVVDWECDDTALIMSVVDGNRWMFDLLMKSELTDVNKTNENSGTALHFAACGDAYFTTRLCAHKDIDINAQNDDGYSPIMYAARSDDQASSAAVLLAQPQLNLSLRKRIDGWTALDIAHPNRPIVATLIRNEITRRDHVVRFAILRRLIDGAIAEGEQLADDASPLDRLAHAVGMSSEGLIADLGVGVLAFTLPKELFRDTIVGLAYGDLPRRRVGRGVIE